MSVKLGLIGKNISHSFSPKIYTFLGNKYKINIDYKLFEVDSVKNLIATVDRLYSSGYSGCNITSPYKKSILERIIPDEIVKVTDSCNLLYFENGKYCGFNTDFYGMKALLIALGFKKLFQEFDLLVFGAGGVLGSVLHSFAEYNVKNIFVYNRTKKPCAIFQKFPNINFVNFEDLPFNKKLSDATVIVNALNCSAEVTLEVIQSCIDNFQSEVVICDLSYDVFGMSPLEHCAAVKRKRYVSGIEFLVFQSIFSFTRWFGVLADVEELFCYLGKNISEKYDFML